MDTQNKQEYIPLEGGFITGKISIPTTQKRSYKAEEDGIKEIIETFDQDGNPLPMHNISRLVLSKEVFIAAYNAYIKNSEVK